MYSVVSCAIVHGIDSLLVRAETDLSSGLPTFEMVGFLSAEVKEARERVRTSMRNSGFTLPARRVTINLAPADLRKEGTGYDLAMAVGILSAYDLILSAGDLKAEYLSFLVTMAGCPLLYVHGNHDSRYQIAPPEGCECVEDRIVTVNGLRILGLGGSIRYSAGPFQYTERQMRRRIRRLWLRLRLSRGVDVVLTHAPPRGCGDLEDRPHRGFEAFLPFLKRWKPRYLIHGHIHRRYQPGQKRISQYGDTTILNGNGKYILEIE